MSVKIKMGLRQKTADEKAKALTRSAAGAMAAQRCVSYSLKFGKPTGYELTLMAAAIAAEISVASLAIWMGCKIDSSKSQ